MTIERFQRIVTSADELTDLLGSPSEGGIKKQLSELDDHMKTFIATSPFLLLGTVGSDGRCDVSPRGDMPDVAKVLDSRTLAIPEWKGNRRVDSLRNIIQTGQVGLLLLTPGLGETLRNQRTGLYDSRRRRAGFDVETGKTAAGWNRSRNRRVLLSVRKGVDPVEALGVVRRAHRSATI